MAPPCVASTTCVCAVSLEAVLERVMQTAHTSVDADAPLMEAGVDSLGAVELRNQLQGVAAESLASAALRTALDARPEPPLAAANCEVPLPADTHQQWRQRCSAHLLRRTLPPAPSSAGRHTTKIQTAVFQPHACYHIDALSHIWPERWLAI